MHLQFLCSPPGRCVFRERRELKGKNCRKGRRETLLHSRWVGLLLLPAAVVRGGCGI